MKKIALALRLTLVAVVLVWAAGSGCKNSGSKEYTPGKGWRNS